mgnify:CR=1 FL=1
MSDFSPREIVSELDRFIVGQHDADHAGKEYVVLEAKQPRRRALALAEVPGREHGDPGGRGTDHHQEVSRKAVQPKMERQGREADRQHRELGCALQRGERQAGHQQAHGSRFGNRRAKRRGRRGTDDAVDPVPVGADAGCVHVRGLVIGCI